MKKFRIAFLAVSLLSLCSCAGENADQNGDNSVDYSSCPFIGNGSHYVVAAGSGDSLMSMHFFFDPDGVGAWGTVKTVNGKDVKEIYEFTYVLTGGVNVSWVEKKSKEKGKGYFTNDSTGQVYVSEGLRFYRYD